jgi:outer membrane protein assembly factor BamE (lipoprotein component of BamABCDE complex)
MKKPLIIIFFFLLTSCFNQIETKGYSFELSDYQLVKEGLSSKDSVIEHMGYPTFVIDENKGELWVYFSENTERFLFFKPTILKRQIMAVGFNNQGTVTKINNYNLTDENHVKFAEDYTNVDSQKSGFFSEIFSNIGQVKPN